MKRRMRLFDIDVPPAVRWSVLPLTLFFWCLTWAFAGPAMACRWVTIKLAKFGGKPC